MFLDKKRRRGKQKIHRKPTSTKASQDDGPPMDEPSAERIAQTADGQSDVRITCNTGEDQEEKGSETKHIAFTLGPVIPSASGTCR